MIALDHRLAHEAQPAPQYMRDAVAAVLDRAAAVLDDDPDAAALLLDGMLAQLAQALAGMLVRGDAAASPLPALDRYAPDVAYRLRLALRAPDPAARLVHCRQLSQLVPETAQLAHQVLNSLMYPR